MSACFYKIAGVACLSVIIHFSVEAQSQSSLQTQSPNSSSNISSSSDTNLNNQLALVSDKPSSKAVSEVKTTTRGSAGITEPKVSPKNPSIQFKVNPSESKLSAAAFAEPDLEVLGSARNFQATAYALYGRTRSGVYVRRGVIAADPRVIPLGSVVQLKTPGYTGVYTVQDTGKKIKGNIVDVWVPSSREARIFGRRQIKLHVLRLGPKKRSSK